MSNETHNAYRCAKTGRFVKESYAKENPYTTIRVRVPNPGKSLIKKAKK